MQHPLEINQRRAQPYECHTGSPHDKLGKAAQHDSPVEVGPRHNQHSTFRRLGKMQHPLKFNQITIQPYECHTGSQNDELGKTARHDSPVQRPHHNQNVTFKRLRKMQHPLEVNQITTQAHECHTGSPNDELGKAAQHDIPVAVRPQCNQNGTFKRLRQSAKV